ncbi:MAG: HU family DNA-binding protein [Desulfomonilaceae bacterium]
MKDLISILARNAGIEKTELESAIDKLAFSIRDSLENNPRVSIQGLGTFVAVQEEFELKCDAPINYAGTVLVRESVTVGDQAVNVLLPQMPQVDIDTLVGSILSGLEEDGHTAIQGLGTFRILRCDLPGDVVTPPWRQAPMLVWELPKMISFDLPGNISTPPWKSKK